MWRRVFYLSPALPPLVPGPSYLIAYAIPETLRSYVAGLSLDDSSVLGGNYRGLFGSSPTGPSRSSGGRQSTLLCSVGQIVGSTYTR